MQRIELTLNGVPRTLDAPLSIGELLTREGLASKRVAVERNGEIVPRGRFQDEWLADGDRIEIVVAVGGG